MPRHRKEELASQQNPNILRIVPDWQQFFAKHRLLLQSQCVAVAQGGTIDSVRNKKGKLEPVYHPVTIEATSQKDTLEVEKLFLQHGTKAATLGQLYAWNVLAKHNPWGGCKVRHAGRISSFDSGREKPTHFLASLLFDYRIIQEADKLIRTEGTDSLVKKAVLKAFLLSRYLFENGKKIVASGTPISGYDDPAYAIENIKGALYALLEEELPSGMYITSSTKTKAGDLVTQILPAIGSVKLHSDGYFYSPNTGPIVTIEGNTVFTHPLYHELKRRAQYFSMLPALHNLYLQDQNGIYRLQETLQKEKISIQTVENHPSVLDDDYKRGVRAFVIKARGSGNSDDDWKKKIEELAKKKDTTIVIITEADSGDINLKKYAAGLDVKGVLSGRTLREDSARILIGIIHDLKIYNQLPMPPQRIIEIFCYLSGMIDLPHQKLA